VKTTTDLVDNTAVDNFQEHAQNLLQHRGILHRILHLRLQEKPEVFGPEPNLGALNATGQKNSPIYSMAIV
jgi:hypothetical protein